MLGTTVEYRRADGGVAIIEMSRVSKANAQNIQMTYELNDAFDAAAADSEVRAILLCSAGKHFSAGHDLTDPNRYVEPEHCVGTWRGWKDEGALGRLAREHEIYFDMCKRWRDHAKPTIAAIQGRCVGGGLMLAWACDIIVASESATFSDPVVAFGVGGVERLCHPWELGVRKAKEVLMTGRDWSSREAMQAGMVNRVVDDDELRNEALQLAMLIASKPPMAIRLVKQAINATMEAQGHEAALQNAFGLHQLAHAHNMLLFGSPLDPSGLPDHLRQSNSERKADGPADKEDIGQ